ncbi:MAG TPA: sigma-70 family RNA polymerase sigma factor [Gammaproteobacteria bacterium]|nr:sigma-70 family RNA polymerase sigma factor [Gammaproteobacteria bacterium]
MAHSSDDLGLLLGAAQRGDGAAYAELLTAITPKIRRIVARQRGFAGIAETEDLVQDVLLSLHMVRATYDASRPFLPWLLAIVRHRLADGARRYARSAGREIQVEEIDVTFFADEANHDTGSFGDADAVRAAIRALPDGQRQAIELLKLKELSLKEAAEISGTSIGALKVATHRAMATLRRTLGSKRG